MVGPVSVSMGIAMFPEHGRSVEDLIVAADAALYLAKEGGRDRVVAPRNLDGLRLATPSPSLRPAP